jgi:hypothetical protein
MKDLLKQLGTSKTRGSKDKKDKKASGDVESDDEVADRDQMDIDDAPTVPTKKRGRDSIPKKDMNNTIENISSSSGGIKSTEAEKDEPASKRHKSQIDDSDIGTLQIGTSLLPPAPMAAPPPRPPSVHSTPSANRTPQRSRVVQPSSPAKRRLFDAPSPDQMTELPPLMPLKADSSTLMSSSAAATAVFGTPTKRLMANVASPTASPARAALGPLSPRKASQDIKEALGKDFWLPLPGKYTEIEELFKYPFIYHHINKTFFVYL